jgi:ribosomal protein S18 acetylase RimI-like enzyme
MDGLQAHPPRVTEIRPLRADELETLERELLRYPGKHRERLDAQHRGESLYLIAWEGARPVGHLNLRLAAPRLSARARVADAAEIEDLAVAPAHRRGRIGTELMRRAESEATQRGFRALGLAVATDNEPARALYRHEGFEESDSGRFVVSYPYIDGNGREQRAREICTYLVKRLRRPYRDGLEAG